jgi:hypothetical protein
VEGEGGEEGVDGYGGVEERGLKGRGVEKMLHRTMRDEQVAMTRDPE